MQCRVNKTVSILSYENKAFKITKLDWRRTRGDLIQIYLISTHPDTIEWFKDQTVSGLKAAIGGNLLEK
jgi:hypothetical protein